MAIIRAEINPKILIWARKSAHIDIEAAAKKAGVGSVVYNTWEDGKSLPTINQLRLLSAAFRRPLSVFFLPEIPKDFSTLRDFRSRTHEEYSTALIFIIREIQEKQKYASDFLKEYGFEKCAIIKEYDINSSYKKIAADIISYFDIDYNFQSNTPLKYWIRKIEAKQIFVSRASNVHSRMVFDLNEFRGFAITDNYAPFVFINSKDNAGAQLFTLLHELTHLYLGTSGVSDINSLDLRTSHYNPVESLCNKVAAEALMPERLIYKYSNKLDFNDFNQIRKLSKYFGTSIKSTSIRLLNLNYITKEIYDKAFSSNQNKYDNIQKFKEGQFPNPYLLRALRNGYSFSNLVFSNYRSGYLTDVNISHLLNIKTEKMKNYERYLQ